MTQDNKTVYAYLRVSSDEQDVNNQRRGVEEFARSHGWTIDETITDEGVSGSKAPDKRHLGPLLKKLKADDVIIASEISRLGRDLYMVMDILHHCMEVGCVIYTVKDRFTLGNDIQSKVLAFAFGLSAEIERQMIQHRTREALLVRRKLGVLLGRACKKREDLFTSSLAIKKIEEHKDKILELLDWGVSQRALADKLGVDRNTLYRVLLFNWGYFDKSPDVERRKARVVSTYERRRKDDLWAKAAAGLTGAPVKLDKERTLAYIRADLTIPEIAPHFPEYTYDQIYDTIANTLEYEREYRVHGHKIARKGIK